MIYKSKKALGSLALLAAIGIFWSLLQTRQEIQHFVVATTGNPDKEIIKGLTSPRVTDQQTSINNSLREHSDQVELLAIDNVKDVVELKPCPLESPYLRGLNPASHRFVSPTVLERQFYLRPDPPFPPVSLGGHYQPYDCWAQQKVAIIIPYRNRFEHLHILLHNLLPVLRRQQADFRIFVIEQELPTTFNRGMLQNVGFLEALKYDNFTCFVFSDVDFLPLNDRAFYRCNENNPMHLASAISKWNYGLPYGEYFGGISAFSREQYELINGNSNLYFGWGGEDDDLHLRVLSKNLKVMRYPKAIGKFDMIQHKRDKGNSDNKDRLKLLETGLPRQDVEGLRTTTYSKTRVVIKPLYTWIYVFINMTHVLKTAPDSIRPKIAILFKQANQFDQLASNTTQKH